MGCPERPQGSAGVSSGLSGIGRVSYADELSAQAWSDANSFDNNHFTHLDGLIVKSIGGVDRVIVDLKVIPRGQRGNQNTISGLADLAKEDDINVLIEILLYRGNRWLLPHLWRQTFDEDYPHSHGTARSRLFEEAKKTKNINGVDVVVYTTWQLPTDSQYVIYLPEISEALRCDVLSYRLQANQPQLRQLRQLAQACIDRLTYYNERLSRELGSYERFAQPYMNTVATLGTAEKLLDVMIRHPSHLAQINDRSLMSSTPEEITNLHEKVTRLKEQANHDFFEVPKPRTLTDSLATIALEARNLRIFMENRDLIDLVIVHKSYRYLITTNLFQRLCDTVADSFSLLMRSPEAQHVKDNWVVGALEIIEHDNRGENVARINISPASACDALMLLVSIVPAVAGNMPGPASFSISFMAAISNRNITLALTFPEEVSQLTSLYISFMARRFNLNVDDLNELLRSEVTPQRIGEHVRGNAQASVTWSGVMCVLNVSLLLYSLSQSDADTPSEWIDELTSWGNLSLELNALAALSQALKPCRFMQGIPVDAIAKTLGGIAAACAIMSSLEAAWEEEATGDILGRNLNYVGAGASALSLVGFLITEYAVAGSLLAIGGAAFMAIGVLVGIIISIIILYRLATTANTHLQFEAMINFLDNPEGITQFRDILLHHKHGDRTYADLVDAYRDVQHYHQRLSFWSIDHRQHEEVYSILGDCDQVAKATGFVSCRDLRKYYRDACKDD